VERVEIRPKRGAGRRMGGNPESHGLALLVKSHFQPFPAHAVFMSHETGGIAAWSGKALDETGTDRIGDKWEHDRHGAGRLQQRSNRRSAMGQDDVRRERNQFRRVSANVLDICRGPADIDPHVAADGPAQESQHLKERADAGLMFRIVRSCGQKHADSPHALGLRARRERPRGCAARKRDELTIASWSPPASTPDYHACGVVGHFAAPSETGTHVRFGSWLCENSRACRARRSISRNGAS